MPVVIATTDGSSSTFTGTISPVGGGITPGSIYLSIQDDPFGPNGLGSGVADNGSGGLVMSDGNGYGGRSFASGDGSTTTFTQPLGMGMVIPGSVVIYQSAVAVATDDGSGHLVGVGGGAQSTTFPGSGSGHTYSKTLTPHPIVPGSVVLKISGGATLATDDSAGNLVASGGATISAGTINYSTGVVAWHDSTDRTSVNLEIDWTAGSGVTGTVDYTGGQATVIFPVAPSGGDSITNDVTGYGFTGTIDYATGAFVLNIGQAGPQIPATAHFLYADYAYNAIPNVIPPSYPAPVATADIQQQISVSYGIDVLCLYDLDPNFSLTPNALPQDCFHRVTEAAGALFWSTGGTASLYDLIGQGLTQTDLSNFQGQLQSVLQSDERVAQAQVSLVFDGLETVQAQIVIVPEDGSGGPFRFVCAITNVSVSLLSLSSVTS